MKKIVSLILVAVVLAALCVTAFAAATKTEDGLTAPSTSTNAVDVKIDADSKENIDEVYYVNVEWDALDFTYSFVEGEENKWDPETHTYGESNYTGANWDKTSANIVVTNHSNKAVAVNATIDTDVKYGVTTTLSNASFDLATGEGLTFDTADAGTIGVAIKGVPTVSEDFTIGTITVAISAK